jgi:hypothetical protein
MTRRTHLAITALAALSLALLAHDAATRAAVGPSKAPPAPKKGKPASKALFDGKSLKGWTVADYFGKGKVHVRDGAIVLEKGKQMTGIAYTGGDFPKMNYEVTLEGKKLAGSDFFCTTTFPVGPDFCSLVVGGWGGKVVGLSNVDFEDALRNETNKSKDFKPGQWYRVRIRVTANRIEAWIDREKMVDLDTTDKALSIRVECQRCKPFGIATWKTTGAVHDVRVRVLTAAEKKAKGGGKK